MPEVLRGARAAERLADAAFQARWRALSDACPWGTVFQDVPFVTAWYRHYADDFEPVVVCEASADGALRGLLFLAAARRGGTLAPCGTSQAEYDVWIAGPDDGVRFIEAAWEALGQEFPHRRIDFLFLPPRVPIGFSPTWQARTVLRHYERPLHDTTPGSDAAAASLKKKGNKSKLNQLQRLGGFAFERVTEPAAFDALLDEMIPLFDTRQLGLSGTAPFRRDPHRRAFFHDQLASGILHVTAMRVGGRLAAAHLGQINRQEVLLGLIVHSPFFAKYSVGKFQLLLLALELQKEGRAAFDLTPGGDYKDRFATHHDDAHILTVSLSDASARRYRWQRAAIDFGKRYVSSERVKRQLAVWRHRVRLARPAAVAASIAGRLRTALFERREMRVYVMDVERASAYEPGAFVRRDALDDLLHYAPTESSQPLPDVFLREALERLGAGEHVYTRVEDGRLVAWGWLVDRQETSLMDEVGQHVALPANAAVLYDFYTHTACRGRGYYTRALQDALADAARTHGVQRVVISTLAGNGPSRRAIERLGFRWWRSAVERRVLGQAERWQYDAATGHVVTDAAAPGSRASARADA